MIAPSARGCEFGCDEPPIIESVRVRDGNTSQNKLKTTCNTDDRVWAHTGTPLTLNAPGRFFHRNCGSDIDCTREKSNVDGADLEHLSNLEMNSWRYWHRWYDVPQAQRIGIFANIAYSIRAVLSLHVFCCNAQYHKKKKQK
jgi:hypothetical protein